MTDRIRLRPIGDGDRFRCRRNEVAPGIDLNSTAVEVLVSVAMALMGGEREGETT